MVVTKGENDTKETALILFSFYHHHHLYHHQNAMFTIPIIPIFKLTMFTITIFTITTFTIFRVTCHGLCSCSSTSPGQESMSQQIRR